MKQVLFIFIFIYSLGATAQIGGKIPPLKSPGGDIGQGILTDSLSEHKRTKKSEVVYPISDYKKFTLSKDTLVVDTLLNIRNLYRANDILKDDFELIPFQNLGQGYNYLSSSFLNQPFSLNPGFVAAAKYFYLWNENDIPFYYVPTAYSNLFYLNGLSQGQMLQAFISSNITPQLNILVGYKGLTSLGLYKNSLTSLGRFFLSSNYKSKNNRYLFKIYYVSHDLTNQENGGLKDITQFESGNPDFQNRSRMEVKFDDAELKKFDKGFYIDQAYQIFKSKNIFIRNSLKIQNQKYIYHQKSSSDYIGDAFTNGELLDSTRLKHFEENLFLKFTHKKMDIESGIGYIYNNYQWDSTKVINNQLIPDHLLLKDLKWISSGEWNSSKLRIQLISEIIPTKNLKGYLFKGTITYKKDSLKGAKLSLYSTSHKPDFKFLLFQSGYKKFNWYHPDFKNIQLQELNFLIYHKKYGDISFKQQAINNFTYFNQDSLPHQYAGLIAISSFKFKNDLSYKKIGLSSDLLYQKLVKGEQILSLPSLVVRESVYYKNRFFKNHLQIQTGVTFKYFSSFYSFGYHPVLGDYFLQREKKIGDFSLIDFFFNFKVKRFRFYFKAEHLNALWEKTSPHYYAAPEYPIRDFNLRFGINWIFFN